MNSVEDEHRSAPLGPSGIYVGTLNDVVVTTDQRKAEKGEEEHVEVKISYDEP